MRLPLSRRFIVDYLYFTKKVPSQPIARLCNVKQLITLRKQIPQRIGWSALMLKAAATLAERKPELRCCYMKWPWPQLYLHPRQIAYLAASRTVDGVDWLFFHRIERPERCTLIEIQESIDEFRSQPAEKNRLFQKRRNFSRLPWFMRRVVWWSALSLSARLRTSLTGTLGVTSVSQHGATSISPPTLGNLVVSYGPVQDDGSVQVTFVYDHRILDGGIVARALQEFESILNGEIAEELTDLSQQAESQQVALTYVPLQPSSSQQPAHRVPSFRKQIQPK
ncbi:hypothetical protein [Gimesia panareensis]|uniref:2-oxoacid dehydrogenases acyltransferase (Catalytic domain) n=1 Tax=Gimesia panareensis TaxID=2527978 RepID=A0A517Q795_9PLAN|nr:hypothetical protein [Gimesia panareensis]QDT27499.1 2-oxoacid dehydrogenases acyltransferase (catalytic domain) [Gimesia panareensis]QDU49669.1 2-oxoacid dehydrogenases acyltransferase (catalytic domain) [Gimesia panareensis]